MPFLRGIALRITSETNTEDNPRKNKTKPPPRGRIKTDTLRAQTKGEDEATAKKKVRNQHLTKPTIG